MPLKYLDKLEQNSCCCYYTLDPRALFRLSAQSAFHREAFVFGSVSSCPAVSMTNYLLVETQAASFYVHLQLALLSSGRGAVYDLATAISRFGEKRTLTLGLSPIRPVGNSRSGSFQPGWPNVVQKNVLLVIIKY